MKRVVMGVPEYTMEALRAMRDLELRVAAAYLRGYRLEHWVDEFQGHVIRHEWHMVAPRAISGPQLSVIETEMYLHEYVPDVIGDMDEATRLLEGLDWTLRPDEHADKYSCVIHGGAESAVEEFADEPLRAMVLAWCAYKLTELADGRGRGEGHGY